MIKVINSLVSKDTYNELDKWRGMRSFGAALDDLVAEVKVLRQRLKIAPAVENNGQRRRRTGDLSTHQFVHAEVSKDTLDFITAAGGSSGQGVGLERLLAEARDLRGKVASDSNTTPLRHIAKAAKAT